MYKILLRFKRFIKRFLKVRAETRQVQTAKTSSKVYRYMMLLLVTSLVAFLYPAESLFQPLDSPKKGELAQKDIIAPFKITVYKSDNEYEEEKQAAKDAIPTIIDYNRAPVDSLLAKFGRFVDQSKRAQNSIKKYLGHHSDTTTAYFRFKDSIRQEIFSNFPFVTYSAIDSAMLIRDLDKAKRVILDILENDIYFTGVMSDTSLLPESKTNSIIIRMGKREVFVTRDKLRDLSGAYLQFLALLNSLSRTDSINVDAYYELGRHFIAANLRLNQVEMSLRMEQAVAEVSPAKEIVELGDVIVRQGQKINARQAEVLAEMYRQEEAQASEKNQFIYYLPVLSRFVLVFGAFVLLYLYLYYFQRKIFISNPKILALFFIYGIELVFIYFIGIKQSLPIYLYPIPIFSILITILFDAEVSTFNTFILALLLGVLHRFNFSLVLITIIVGLITSYSIQRVSHRTEFFKPVLFSAVTFTALILTLESFNITPGIDMMTLLSYGLLNAVFSPLLAMGILPIFESLFGFTTNITLLELSDMNHPLLKRLSIEAPGTYHHSLLVGNLAESAAKAISGNPLLARVGAYYHDIGKMEIPEYFVENQLGIKSKHDALTPSMSSIILSSHIKKGRIIGEEADLPDEVLNFIEEHHGTMTMSYFLNKAKEMGEENPSEDEFRYPGPKPQSRETAIVMLADSVEAASRTLNEPKPSRIRNLVQNIINDRFQSGELEECPLTLKDLANIRESFVQILTGVFHQRIEYPDKEESKK